MKCDSSVTTSEETTSKSTHLEADDLQLLMPTCRLTVSRGHADAYTRPTQAPGGCRPTPVRRHPKPRRFHYPASCGSPVSCELLIANHICSGRNAWTLRRDLGSNRSGTAVGARHRNFSSWLRRRNFRYRSMGTQHDQCVPRCLKLLCKFCYPLIHAGYLCIDCQTEAEGNEPKSAQKRSASHLDPCLLISQD